MPYGLQAGRLAMLRCGSQLVRSFPLQDGGSWKEDGSQSTTTATQYVSDCRAGRGSMRMTRRAISALCTSMLDWIAASSMHQPRPPTPKLVSIRRGVWNPGPAVILYCIGGCSSVHAAIYQASHCRHIERSFFLSYLPPRQGFVG